MFSLLLILPPACLISSCGHKDNPPQETESISVVVDSCWFYMDFSIDNQISDSLLSVKRLDVLVYDADGVAALESWNRFDNIPDSLKVKGAKRAKTIVAIANSPRSFSRKAIERYDSIELLSYEFDEDSPGTPLMSGTCSVDAGETARISLRPLMSRVQLCEISNTMKGYVRLEDPRIFLDNMNAAAEIMRTMGFRPSETVEEKRVEALPFDIGIFSQHPMTTLYCYPNDSPEATMGTPYTSLVLECEIKGKTCRFPVELTNLGRNKTIHVDMIVAGPESYESKVY